MLPSLERVILFFFKWKDLALGPNMEGVMEEAIGKNFPEALRRV